MLYNIHAANDSWVEREVKSGDLIAGILYMPFPGRIIKAFITMNVL